MKTYLVARREELKKRQNKGLTLMEMLIVVAIIAVLIAIAIPVFTSQLERSRDSVSVANMRAAYAEASTAFITANGKEAAKSGNATVAAPSGGTQVVTVENVEIKSQQVNDWSGVDAELAFDAPTDPGVDSTKTMTFTFTLNGSEATTAAFAS